MKFNDSQFISFRYNSSWHLNSEYQEIVRQALSSHDPGNPVYNLFRELKVSKCALREWQKANCSSQVLCDQLRSIANDL